MWLMKANLRQRLKESQKGFRHGVEYFHKLTPEGKSMVGMVKIVEELTAKYEYGADILPRDQWEYLRGYGECLNDLKKLVIKTKLTRLEELSLVGHAEDS